MAVQYVTLSLPAVQVETLKIFLNMELTTNLTMGRETALAAFKRLTGIDTGRGKKGRQVALDLLLQYEEMLSQQGGDDEPEDGWDS
jgi:hypothetical protein